MHLVINGLLEQGVSKMCRALKADLTEMKEFPETKGGKCLSTNYINMNSPLLWQCTDGHVWSVKPVSASLKKVQDRLGHSDVQTTMNIYTHVTKKAKEEAIMKFSNYIEL